LKKLDSLAKKSGFIFVKEKVLMRKWVTMCCQVPPPDSNANLQQLSGEDTRQHSIG